MPSVSIPRCLSPRPSPHAPQNRGYDSAGLVTVAGDGSGLRVSKFASGVQSASTADALDLLRAAAPAHAGDRAVGIGHTRWATHGAKTDLNAHPHLDATGRVAVVHNGVIENSEQLRERLAGLGFPCISETDTEVIAQLVGYLVVKEGLGLMEAVEKAQKDLKGSWGIAVLDRDHPDFLVAAGEWREHLLLRLLSFVGRSHLVRSSRISPFDWRGGRQKVYRVRSLGLFKVYAPVHFLA